jgi:hypothetical protein
MRKIVVLIVFFIYGCTNTPYLQEDSAFIVWKSSVLRYADMGFLYQNKDEVKLQIYSNAQSVMSLRVTQDYICMSSLECMSKRDFNQKVLSGSYPKNILTNILKAQPIFGKKYIKYTQTGFIQEIKKQNLYTIKYKVSKNRVEFVDSYNHIMIKIIKDI